MTANAPTSSPAPAPTNKEPYQQAYYPPKPTGFTRFLRTCVLWQLVRFVVINAKMIKLMSKSHTDSQR